MNQRKEQVFVLTRDKPGNEVLATELKGYSVISLPTYNIVQKTVKVSQDELKKSDLLVFTSLNLSLIHI